jgi:uncharacterized protein with ParB-like and HNH nuclease domain
MIIDGQQRITTLSLLMLALVHTQEEMKKDINLIKNEYLIGKYNQKGKVKPVKNDTAALKTLFDKNEKLYNNSNIVTNYLFFKEQLQQTKIALNEIFNWENVVDLHAEDTGHH